MSEKKTKNESSIEVIAVEELPKTKEELEKEYEKLFYEKKAAELEAKLRQEITQELEEKRRKEVENTSAQSPTDAERIRLRERTPVKVRFNYHEVPGGTTTVVVRRHKNDPIEKFDLKDGQITTLPLGVCKHINGNCWYPVHANSQTKDGVPIPIIGRKVQRMSVTPLEEGYTVELMTAGEAHIKSPDSLRL